MSPSALSSVSRPKGFILKKIGQVILHPLVPYLQFILKKTNLFSEGHISQYITKNIHNLHNISNSFHLYFTIQFTIAL